MWFKHNLIRLLLTVSLALLPALNGVAAEAGHHDHHAGLCLDCDDSSVPAPADGDTDCCNSITGACGTPLCALSPPRPSVSATDLSGTVGWRGHRSGFRTRLYFSIYRPPIA